MGTSGFCNGDFGQTFTRQNFQVVKMRSIYGGIKFLRQNSFSTQNTAANRSDQHFVTYSPRHLLARFPLAKRPWPMLQEALHFFRSDLIFPSSPASLFQKKSRNIRKNTKFLP
jgi:hypothetical protein